MIYLGLDVSKLTVDCAFMQNGTFAHLKINNHEQGFKQLIEYIKENEIKEVHACCEATGVYYLALAEYLYVAGIKISVVNPLIIKNYARFKLSKIKTDKQDAKLIAVYCANEQPAVWKPVIETQKKLQGFNRRLEQLSRMMVMEKNRLQVSDDYLKPFVAQMLELIEEQILMTEQALKNLIDENEKLVEQRALLKTIPGVGDKTAAWLLSVLADPDKFAASKNLVSFLGLSPIIKESGTSVKGVSVISKMGDKNVRKALYIPARSACTRSKLWRPWYEKKLEEGKHPKQIYVAMMRKICIYAYTILKTEKPFDANLHKRLDD